ncbi:RNA polymerase sigma factor [Galbibacter mesophilus]|uniref:RNA polymerase sigma factor n=1 Tax=Galbibacter mesophilus TaxID=379069 RepID=UPI00191D0202|nr:sigma-70 family RNA polymerase sigma factor [Galbibacter mesophilus]MCM5663173.1 sigma-70 family RNA polymerase sigma factor [Galbibacter mesophilus]
MTSTNQDRIKKIFVANYRQWCLLSYSYLECMHEAEDAVQDVMYKMLLKDNWDKISDLESYIFIAVKNTSLKRLKKLAKTKRLQENLKQPVFATPYSSEENNTRVIEEKALLQAIDQLPGQCKKVFELCALNGLKYETAATSLDISTNTVKYHMKSAYRILRNSLSNKDFGMLIIVINSFFI